MASQKFVYTVSGIELTEAQKTKISQEIAAAVARVVVGDSRQAIQPDLLTRFGIAGGRMIPFDEAQATTEAIIDPCGDPV